MQRKNSKPTYMKLQFLKIDVKVLKTISPIKHKTNIYIR